MDAVHSKQPAAPKWRSLCLFAEEADTQVGCLVNHFAVCLHPAVGNAENQPAAHDALEVDAVFHELRLRRHHAGELDLACRERPALARLAEPAKIEAGQLPHGIKAEAAGHDGISQEM